MFIINRRFITNALLLLAFVTLASFLLTQERKPVLYIIGDSTVKNGDGTGKNNQMGWGTVLFPYFDTTKISLRNHALGGRSSRTFITEGRWDKVLAEMQPGDYVIMQFGHNDAGPLDDTARARGTINGTGEDSKEIYNPIMKKQETVHSYGWYMRKYIRDTKAKGGIPVVCSPIPRDSWSNGKVKRSDDSYGKWAKEIAAAENAYFIDLNNRIADKYDALGELKVRTYFPADHTHTNNEGAELNASIVAEGIQNTNGLGLKKFLTK